MGELDFPRRVTENADACGDTLWSLWDIQKPCQMCSVSVRGDSITRHPRTSGVSARCDSILQTILRGGFWAGAVKAATGSCPWCVFEPVNWRCSRHACCGGTLGSKLVLFFFLVTMVMVVSPYWLNHILMTVFSIFFNRPSLLGSMFWTLK